MKSSQLFIVFLLFFSTIARSESYIVEANSSPSSFRTKLYQGANLEIQESFQAFEKDYVVVNGELPNIISLKQSGHISRYEKIVSFHLTGGSRPPNGPSYNDIKHLDPKPLIPSDSSFGRLWGILNYGQKLQETGRKDMDSKVAQAWTIKTDASDVVVAVFDTGLDIKHEDIHSNVWWSTENGKSIYGYNAVSDRFPPDDDHALGHGTHVSGTIGATGNNSVGINGVAWKVKLLPIKIFAKDSASSTPVILKALDWAWQHRDEIDVINHSWIGAENSNFIREGFERLDDHGIINVFAAGNNGASLDDYPMYPGAWPLRNSILVAAHDSRGQRASFSNYSDSVVDLAAPGVDIFSLNPGNSYRSLYGTSMAAPHVTGAVALALSQFPNLNPTQVRDRVVNTGRVTPSLEGSSRLAKRLDVYELLRTR